MRTTLSAEAKRVGPRGALGAAAIVAYLGLRVDPSVFYEHGAYFPAFHYGTGFLRPFLCQPGGLSQYVAAYIAQACADRWLGASALAALALLVGLGHGLCLRQALAPAGEVAPGRSPAAGPALAWGTLSVFAVLLVWTRYGFHLESITALALAGLGAAAYAHPWLDSLAPGLRLPIALGACAAGYWACGGAAYLGVLLAAAVERRRRRQAGLAALLLAAVLLIAFALGHLYLGLPRQEALTRLLPYSDMPRPHGGFALLGLYALVAVSAVGLLRQRDGDPAAAAAGQPPAGPRWRRAWNRVPPRWRPAVWALAAVFVLAAARPPHTARRMAVMKYARAQDWQRVLAEGRRLPAPAYTLDVCFAINQALYHTGRLGEDLFAFPQGTLTLNMGIAFASSPNETLYRDRPRALFDIGLADLEMGLVNSAEHMAHEALAVQGPHPTILRQLVLVNLVKRRPEVAAVFLRSLCLDPVARPWARDHLELLHRSPDALLESDPVASIRANAPTRRDLGTALRPLEQSCLAQLEENPRNRMACEFLMAQYLVTRNLEGFAQALPRLEGFGQTGLPRHYQEAVLLYEAVTRKTLPGWNAKVTPQVRNRFTEFSLTVAPFRGQSDPGPALAATVAFRDTFFYYYAFRPSE